MFRLKIMNPKREVFSGEAESVFLQGDQGEFEILSHHAPIVSLLKAGHVVVNWSTAIPIKNGIVKFDRDECVILVEE